MACSPTWEWGVVMVVMEQLVLEEDHLDQLQALAMVSTPNRPKFLTILGT